MLHLIVQVVDEDCPELCVVAGDGPLAVPAHRLQFLHQRHDRMVRGERLLRDALPLRM